MPTLNEGKALNSKTWELIKHPKKVRQPIYHDGVKYYSSNLSAETDISSHTYLGGIGKVEKTTY